MLPFSADPTLRAVASTANLQRAWIWTQTSSNRAYKAYFRALYRAYSIGAADNLKDLQTRLLNGAYSPTLATKLYFPKPSGIQRPYSLLTVEDQIVYQALANAVAERLVAKVRGRYHRTVFGNLYAGRGSPFFYQDWRRGYSRFTSKLRQAFADGYRFAASFDLTACYDSIDHTVLRHFLSRLRLDKEFCDCLAELLSHWTSAARKPIYHSHGIPQGPLPSGLIAEAVLRHFDEGRRRTKVRYFRYVDDIRLFARSEEGLRRELIELDLRSKEIGLFPQASKVRLHRVVSIEDELKSLSNPSEFSVVRRPVKQAVVQRRLRELTWRLRVENATRFKFVLGSARPSAPLSHRLLAVVRREPHLYEAIFRYFERARLHPHAVSRAVVDLLYEQDVYAAFAAALIRSVTYNLSPTQQVRFQRYCRSRLGGNRRTENAELRAAAATVLLRAGQLTPAQTLYNLRWKPSWWVRATLVPAVREDLVGRPSFQSVIHEAMRDSVADVALAATEVCVRSRLPLPRPATGVHALAQVALRAVGRIGTLPHGKCPIASAVSSVLGAHTATISWRTIFDRRTYRHMIPRMSVWRAYALSDPTAWVALTDTVDDILLAAAFSHVPGLGAYAIGNIGSVLQPTGRLATQFPKLYEAVAQIHALRLEADLAHPVTRRTNRPPRRIRYAETGRLKQLLAAGYRELWDGW